MTGEERKASGRGSPGAGGENMGVGHKTLIGCSTHESEFCVQKAPLFFAPFENKVEEKEWLREKSIITYPDEFLPRKYVSEKPQKYGREAGQTCDLEKGNIMSKPRS